MPEFSNKAAFCITHRINGFGGLSEKSPEGLCDAAALRPSPRCMGGHLAKKVQMYKLAWGEAPGMEQQKR